MSERSQNEAALATSELRRQLGLLRPEPHVATVTDRARAKPKLTVLDLLLPAVVVAVALTEIAIFAPMEGRTVSGVSVLLTVLAAMTVVGRLVAPIPRSSRLCGTHVARIRPWGRRAGRLWIRDDDGGTGLGAPAAPRGVSAGSITLVVLVSAVLVSRPCDNEPDNILFAAILLVIASAAGAAVGRNRRLREIAEATAEKNASLEIQAATDEAVRAEQHQMARELHDLVSHAVSVIAVQAGAAELQWPVNRPAARRAIETLQSTATQAVAELERMPLALTPIQHTMADLAALVDRTKSAGQRVRMTCGTEPAAEVMPTVYRVVQESLSGTALRYSPGGLVDVNIEAGADRTVIEVTSLEFGTG